MRPGWMLDAFLRARVRRVKVGAFFCGLVIALTAAAPAAAEVHVTNPGNSGAGTLRDVIAAAGPGETVVIDPGVDPVINPPQIAIDKSLTIRGQGREATTIGVAGTTRVFAIGTVTPGIAVRIEALGIAGGRAPDGAPGSPEGFGPPTPPGPGSPGGGGGAIQSFANQLVLAEVRLTGNMAGNGGGGGLAPVGTFPGGGGGNGGEGGAIFNTGTLTISDSVIGGNDSGVGGATGFSTGSFPPGAGGAGGNGGAIANFGTLTVARSTISGNETGDGLIGSSGITFSGPGSAGGQGGAIFSTGSLTILDSTLAGNSAGAGGPGAFTTGPIPSNGGAGGSGGGIFAGGNLHLTNVTLVSNSAGAGGAGGGGMFGGSGGAGGSGGGLAGGLSGGAIAALTITSNSVGVGGQGGTGSTASGIGGGEGSGGGISGGGALAVRASILASNIGSSANCETALVDGGGNLAFPDAGGCTGFAVADPKLDPVGLASNGGPTQTIALLPGSAALDSVPASSCLTAEGGPLATDQRGVARPQGNACDAGAYEREVAKPSVRAPETKLTKKPKKKIKTRKRKAKVKIRFVSVPAGATFQCKLDKGRFKPCRSPKAYRLKHGRHTIAVRAVFGGLVDPSPAEVKFKVVRPKPRPR